MHVHLLTRRFIIYDIKTELFLRGKWKCQQTLLWLESAGSALPACEVLRQKVMVRCCHDTPAHSSWPPLGHCAPPHCKHQPEEGKGERGMFTCEPFPSVIWSCMSGTQCSRHPYIGPYTWQCISVRTKSTDIKPLKKGILKLCNKMGFIDMSITKNGENAKWKMLTV